MLRSMSAALVVAAGCLGDGISVDPVSPAGPTNFTGSAEVVQQEPRARFVCVGMEKSERFGTCIGCELDARRLTSLLVEKYGYEGVTMVSEQATKKNVVQALRSAVSDTREGDLLLFLYSGHGGQESLGGKEPGDADSPDEYLCLYDTYMLDDEIWDIVSSCKGRVFMYFDACHSATMYRSVKMDLSARACSVDPKSYEMVKSSGFTFKPKASSMSARSVFNMMCWSGCKEAEYSYGSSSGGFMTMALLSKWEKGKKYADLWKEVREAVIAAQPTQHPVCTAIGSGFDVEVFR